MFVAILLLLAGILDLIYGIAAVSDSSFWAGETRFVFSSLHTWGWITIVLGAIEIVAAFSLMGGGAFGRFVGLVAASLGALGALLDIGGAHPWWALGVFVLCVYCIHGLLIVGEPET